MWKYPSRRVQDPCRVVIFLNIYQKPKHTFWKMKFKSNFLESLECFLQILLFRSHLQPCVPHSTNMLTPLLTFFPLCSGSNINSIRCLNPVFLGKRWFFFPFDKGILIHRHRPPHTRVELLFSAQKTVPNFCWETVPPSLWPLDTLWKAPFIWAHLQQLFAVQQHP